NSRARPVTAGSSCRGTGGSRFTTNPSLRHNQGMIEPPAPRPIPLATDRAWAVCLSAIGVIALGTLGLRVWDEFAWAQHVEARAAYDVVLGDASEAARELGGDRRNAEASLGSAATIR